MLAGGKPKRTRKKIAAQEAMIGLHYAGDATNSQNRFVNSWH
jgi:hypothetical protein